MKYKEKNFSLIKKERDEAKKLADEDAAKRKKENKALDRKEKIKV